MTRDEEIVGRGSGRNFENRELQLNTGNKRLPEKCFKNDGARFSSTFQRYLKTLSILKLTFRKTFDKETSVVRNSEVSAPLYYHGEPC